MLVKEAEFIKSASQVNQCPDSKLPEYAFIGRSNVGKSSLINMLTGRKKLAKTSAKPGKTQLINHFLINQQWHLVDLPGYGWAKVSKSKRADWGDMIEDYLLKRPQLVCLFILIDSRIPPQEIDLSFMEWAGMNQIPFVMVFTKVDKQSINKTEKAIAAYRKTMKKTWEELPPMFITSSIDNTGKDEILNYIQEIMRVM
jgi:GTP-binding protein